MGRECSFILPGGRKCRCVANRNQALCRHHAPKPAVLGPPPPPKNERYSNLIRWRRFARGLPWMEPSQLACSVYDILDCLIDRGSDSTGHISDLSAGRFLRVLLNRLGEVPFPNPEFAEPAPAPVHHPSSAPRPDPSSAQLLAELAQQGLLPPNLLRPTGPPASHASLHQSRS